MDDCMMHSTKSDKIVCTMIAALRSRNDVMNVSRSPATPRRLADEIIAVENHTPSCFPVFGKTFLPVIKSGIN